MPPGSSDISQEGVVISDALLVSEDRFREADVRDILASGLYPARNPDQNVADL